MMTVMMVTTTVMMMMMMVTEKVAIGMTSAVPSLMLTSLPSKLSYIEVFD